MTRKQLLASLDSEELTEWWAFFHLQADSKDQPPAQADVEAQLMKIFGPRNG